MILEEGKLTIVKESVFKDSLKISPNGRYFLTLERAYNKRSVAQNNSLFGIPYKILKEAFEDSFGYTLSIQWVHDYCKDNLLPLDYNERIMNEWNEDPKNKLVNKVTGEETIIPFKPTTTKMRTVEMMEYYKNLQLFGLEYLDADIPDPDPNYLKNTDN